MDLGPVIPAGISFAQFAANLSAVTCPTAHVGAVPVDELLTGLIVAWLCPDCDQQLPADWKPAPIDVARVAVHRHNHHGRPDFHLNGCPLCDQELRADWKQAQPVVDPDTVAALFARTNDRPHHMSSEYKARTSKEKR